jgi:hypothetical protein
MWKRILLALVVLIALAAGFFAWQIGPRNLIGMLLYDERREGSLAVGDLAPDLTLAKLDGSEVRLLDPGSKMPLVVIFGSYT